MKKKILGIFVCTLLIIATVLPVAGTINVGKEPKDNANRTKGFGNTLIGEEPMQQPASKHGTGFLAPEMDLPHLTGQDMPERFVGETPPSSFDWRTLGKVTSIKDQLTADTCWAFASLACFESKILIHGGGTYDLSEDNLKECGPYHLCTGPGNFKKVTNYLSQDGTVLESCDPYNELHNTDPPCGTCSFQQTLLDWRIISWGTIPGTDVLKNYVYNEGPIYASVFSGNSNYPSWKNEFNSYDGSYTLYFPFNGDTNHAVVIVGWDDSLTHAGGTGGWICKNSWGTDWGGTCGYGTEKGYFTIAYRSAAIGRYSSYVDQWGKYDINGGLGFYDEKGWNYNWGHSSKTAWGLCEFYIWGITNLTKVEFWTNDVTTDVDVYIYDDFDGSTLSNLLWSSLDHSFSEAGYHGIAIVPPLLELGFDSVFVVVKFTNKNYQYPVPVDLDGPSVTGYTYTSADGSSGSWFDRGKGSPKVDVAIRLRLSYGANNPPSIPTITGATSGKPGISYNYNFKSIDPNGDKVSHYIRWGDGAETDWTPFQQSGTTYSKSHTWNAQGTYIIEAKTRDIYGVESDWGTLTVTMPRNKIVTYNSLFLRFLEHFPILQKILGYIL